MPSTDRLDDHLSDSCDPALAGVLRTVAAASRRIAAGVRRGGLASGLRGSTGTRNVHAEDVSRLDAWADRVMLRHLEQCPHVAAAASEEDEEVARFNRPDAPYAVAFDPLDGSSNIDTNATLGTIFGVYPAGSGNGLPEAGAEQLAAGYALYGPATLFVYTAGDGVHGFTLHPRGGWMLSHPGLRCPPRGSLYSLSEGNASYWPRGLRALVEWYKEPDPATGRPYTLRHGGTLVADVHRILVKGGVFAYPGTTQYPRGKLRYLYEAAPLALVCEQAGGACSDGARRLLDHVPGALHERVPLFIGSREMVEQAVAAAAG